MCEDRRVGGDTGGVLEAGAGGGVEDRECSKKKGEGAAIGVAAGGEGGGVSRSEGGGDSSLDQAETERFLQTGIFENRRFDESGSGRDAACDWCAADDVSQ